MKMSQKFSWSCIVDAEAGLWWWRQRRRFRPSKRCASGPNTGSMILSESRLLRLPDQREPLLAALKRRNLLWFGYVTLHDILSKTIQHGTLAGGRCGSRQKKKNWTENSKGWTDQRTASTATGGPNQTKVEEVVCCNISHVPLPMINQAKRMNKRMIWKEAMLTA